MRVSMIEETKLFIHLILLILIFYELKFQQLFEILYKYSYSKVRYC